MGCTRCKRAAGVFLPSCILNLLRNENFLPKSSLSYKVRLYFCSPPGVRSHLFIRRSFSVGGPPHTYESSKHSCPPYDSPSAHF